jgi:hydrogenase maturation factor HypE
VNLITAALALSAAVNIWLAVTRLAARRRVIEQDQQLYLTSRAATHIVNGTVSGDPDVVDEMSEIRFCAYCEAGVVTGQLFHELTDAEQNGLRRDARRRLVLEGHMTIDHAHRGNLLDLDMTGGDPMIADLARSEMEIELRHTRAAS